MNQEQKIQELQKQTTDSLIMGTLEYIVEEYMSLGPEGWLKFMRDDLKYKPDGPVKKGSDSIENTIIDIAQFYDTTVKTSHGVGKTAMGANVVLTAMVMVPNLGCLQLAPTWRQVKDIFWNEIRKWYRNSKICPILFEIAEKAPKLESRFSPETWYARGVSSSQQANVEGEHNEHFFLVADECKAVRDSIIEGAQGALTSAEAHAKVWSLYLSTPSTPGGEYTIFYKSHTKYKRFKRHSIPANLSARVSKRWIEQMIADWGIDSQIVQARVFAKFPEGGDDILISLQDAENFYDPEIEPTGLHALGVDVARYGQDESVISVYKGNTLIKLTPHMPAKQDRQWIVTFSAMIVNLMKELDARIVVIDDIGVGGGVTDHVYSAFDTREEVFVIPFTSNAQAPDVTKFRSLADEVWWTFAETLKEKRVASLVQDETLEGQLTSFRKTYTLDNRIKVQWPEKKKDRLTSDSKSPDRAAATIMGWYGATLLSRTIEPARREEQNSDYDEMGDTLIGNLLKKDF